RNTGVFRKAAISLRMIDIVQNIHHVSAPNARRIIHTGVLVAGMRAQLFCAFLCKPLHVLLTAEMETAGRTSFDAGGFQTRAHSIRAQCALVNFLSFGIELGNVERAASHGILAANAVLLLEIDDAIAVLDNRTVGRTRAEAARLG